MVGTPLVCHDSQGVHGSEVVFFETRMLIQYLAFGHAVGQPSKHIVDRDAHPANAGSAVALIYFDGDSRMRSGHGASIFAQSLTRRVSRSAGLAM